MVYKPSNSVFRAAPRTMKIGVSVASSVGEETKTEVSVFVVARL